MYRHLLIGRLLVGMDLAARQMLFMSGLEAVQMWVQLIRLITTSYGVCEAGKVMTAVYGD